MSGAGVYGKYRLLARVASGGMAEVFLARSSSIGGFEKILAIKRMHPRLGMHQGFVSLFIEEAKLSVSLNHPNIVQIFDFGRVDENYFIAMEYVEGADLAAIGARSRDAGTALPTEASLYIIGEVFEGMAYAHTKRDRQSRPAGIIHRDISPHNVLVSFEGQVKISDFGIAKAVEELKKDEKGEIVGKVAYMSPEQARAEKITTASDVWSGGVILYELLTNRRLFARDNDKDTLSAVAEMKIEPPSKYNDEIPGELDDLVLRILDRNPATRPSSAREVSEQIHDVLRAHFPRVNPFRLSEIIAGLWDGQPPSLLAHIDESLSSLPRERRVSISPFDSTVPGDDEDEEVAPRDPTKSARPKTDIRPMFASSPTAKPPPSVDPRSATPWPVNPFADPAAGPTARGPKAPLISAEVPTADDPGTTAPTPSVTAAGSVQSSLSRVPVDIPQETANRVAELKASFTENPNLWILMDIGAAFEAAGLEERALSAYELAAAKFAQQGLLVQAVTIFAQLLDKQGPTTRVTAGIRRLPNLVGMGDSELLLEIFDTMDGRSDFSDYRGLVRSASQHSVSIFAPAPIFSALGGEQLELLLQSIRVRNVAPNEEIIREGENGDSFFWIGRGRVMVSTTNYEGRRAYLTSLADGDCFGEQSFFTRRPREATVEAMDRVLMLEVDNEALDELVAEFPQVAETLRQFYKDRIAESLLARSEIFGSMAIRDRRLLAAQFAFVNHESGDWIIREGEKSDAVYAVKTGRVRVFSGEGSDEVELAVLGDGEIFGEIAAVTGVVRTANVQALEACEILRLEATDLNQFLDANPEIQHRIDEQIAHRATDMLEKTSWIDP